MSEEQKSILFADIAGFTKLSASDVKKFMRKVMKEFSIVIKKRKHRAYIINTWGDALFIVFSTAAQAAICALDLRDVVRQANLTGLEFSSDLKIRIALHNASVVIEKDPITQRRNAYGRGVNHTARLEPIVVSNEIFATKEFKVALDGADVKGIEWDHIGNISLAKDWGASDVYRLRRADEKSFTETEIHEIKQIKAVASLVKIMDRCNKLIEQNGRYDAELKKFLAFVDSYILGDMVFRRNWYIQLSYDTDRLKTDGLIKERILWSYDLINLDKKETVIVMELSGSVEGETASLISLSKINDDGSRSKIFAKDQPTTVVRGVETHSARLTLAPEAHELFEMIYSQIWHVNQRRPIIHNNFRTRNVSFRNKIQFEGPISSVQIFNQDGLIEPESISGRMFIYAIPEILVRDAAIEYEVEFNPDRC